MIVFLGKRKLREGVFECLFRSGAEQIKVLVSEVLMLESYEFDFNGRIFTYLPNQNLISPGYYESSEEYIIKQAFKRCGFDG